MKIDSKTILALSALIVALSVCYYFVIFLPQKEMKQIELKKLEQRAKEQKDEQLERQAEQAKIEMQEKQDECLISAENDYNDYWFRECKGLGRLSSRCIEINETTAIDYIEENKIPKEDRLEAIRKFYEERNECSCRLPLELADRVDDSHKEAKDMCLKKYPTQ